MITTLTQAVGVTRP